MKLSRRRAATVLLTIGVMAVVAPQASAGPTGATFGCVPSYTTLSSTGSLDTRISVSQNVTASPYTDSITTVSGVTAMSSVAQTYVQSSDRQYFRSFMVRGGSLQHVMTSYPNSDPSRRTTAIRTFGQGWSPMSRLVDASDRGTSIIKKGYLYALNPAAGTLSRYSVVEGRGLGDLTIRSAGSATGFGTFKGVTLAHRYRAGTAVAADVLLNTTSAGALYQITISNTAAYAPKLTLIRASTWTFDDLVAVGCGANTALLGIRTGTRHAYLYRVDSYRGTSSQIRGYGEVGTTWPAVRTTGFWDALRGPSSW